VEFSLALDSNRFAQINLNSVTIVSITISFHICFFSNHHIILKSPYHELTAHDITRPSATNHNCIPVTIHETHHHLLQNTF